jgi:3-methyladenine DNA glycosylase AlkD
MSVALAWFDDRKQMEILVDYWPMLKKWSAQIDNWAHSDTLSGIYSRVLEQSPELAYSTLQKWNQSKNPWLRRLSIVSLFYYSSQRKKVLPLRKVLSLVEPQLDYEHYYVQKGVGWTLREAGNVYPKETFSFLEKNIRRLSPAAFSAATEKLTKQQKDRLKALRKAR